MSGTSSQMAAVIFVNSRVANSAGFSPLFACLTPAVVLQCQVFAEGMHRLNKNRQTAA